MSRPLQCYLRAGMNQFASSVRCISFTGAWFVWCFGCSLAPKLFSTARPLWAPFSFTMERSPVYQGVSLSGSESRIVLSILQNLSSLWLPLFSLLFLPWPRMLGWCLRSDRVLSFSPGFAQLTNNNNNYKIIIIILIITNLHSRCSLKWKFKGF